MADSMLESVLALVSGRRGHFRLESGHHGGLWLDLDPLFVSPSRVRPLVDRLAESLRPLAPDAICGPLLGGAFLAQLVAHALDVDFAYTERVAPSGDGLYGARYRLPPSLGARLRGRRVAIVDDVMSAGSALRGTHAALTDAGATTIAAGALLILGDAGETHFASLGIPVHAVARDAYTLWTPDACPRCADGIALETLS